MQLTRNILKNDSKNKIKIGRIKYTSPNDRRGKRKRKSFVKERKNQEKEE